MKKARLSKESMKFFAAKSLQLRVAKTVRSGGGGSASSAGVRTKAKGGGATLSAKAEQRTLAANKEQRRIDKAARAEVAKVKQKAAITSASGKGIASFKEVKIVVPRCARTASTSAPAPVTERAGSHARSWACRSPPRSACLIALLLHCACCLGCRSGAYDTEFFTTSMELHGKTHNYKILCAPTTRPTRYPRASKQRRARRRVAVKCVGFPLVWRAWRACQRAATSTTRSYGLRTNAVVVI